VKLNKLLLQNFRNYLNLVLVPHPNLNIIYGRNAQGKSNLLESIYYLSFVNSYRTKNDKQIINWDKNFFRLEGDLERDGQNYYIEISCSEKNKRLKVNRVELDRSKYFGTMRTVLFTPDDIFVIKGGPNFRRKYLDRQIFQIYSRYYNIYSDFKKVLYQRNTLLKQIAKGYMGKGQLEIWDPQYATLCSEILKRRISFLKKLRLLTAKYHQKLTDNKEEIELQYKMECFTLNENKLPSPEEILKHLNILRKSEIEKGISLLGPHRDEIIINIDGYVLRDFGSQGQQRTAILSLKMAELELIKNETGEFPVLLLDDVMSELDLFRQHFLAESITANIQTFITTTDKNIGEKLGKDYLGVEVTKGNVYLGG
jgi:DNA replication and repair protein RecF